MIKAESQAVLNTLRESDFQVRWGRLIRAKGNYFESDSGQ
jgi:hypothetical protein